MPDDVMSKLEEMEGDGFVTGTHDLKSIHDDIAAINVAISTLPRTKLNKVYRLLEELKKLVEA